MQTEAQRRASAKYQKSSTKNVSIRFMPSDSDILAWLEAQPNKAGYVKSLIRDDMERKSRK